MSKQFEVNSTKLETKYGNFDFYCFTWGAHEEDNILCQVKSEYFKPALVRIQSACYTAEIFKSLDCDCHEQLEEGLRRIQEEGGLFIYMLCDGRGAGLQSKVKGLELGRVYSLDTSDAYKKLGLEQDPREYSRAVEVLQYFQINSVRLLTNNPRKIEGLKTHGITVFHEPLEIPATSHSKPYLRTKALKMGHIMEQFNSKF
jgi:GTP cyclohydrolase II